MSEKHLVCQGAICKCNFGTTPDKLKVNTQSRRYINDKDGKKKLTATHVDIGSTFEKNTFGSCSKKNNSPCTAVVTQWSGYYDKIIIEDNGGMVLLEDSKATCPIGGTDCITIVNHGQIAELGPKNKEKSDPDTLNELCPMLTEPEKPRHSLTFNTKQDHGQDSSH